MKWVDAFRFSGLLWIPFIWISCATPEPPVNTEETELTPNWDTHKNDAAIMNGVSAAESARKSFQQSPDMELELRQYITINYQAIGKDISLKRGKYLPGMLRIMKVNKSQAQSSIKQISGLYKNSKTAQEFADKVVGWLQAKN